MKRRNWLRTTIAMITLIATVLETGFTSVSTLAAEIRTEDGIEVNTDAIEEAQNNEAEEPAAEPEAEVAEPAAEEETAKPAESEEPSGDDDISIEVVRGNGGSDADTEGTASGDDTEVRTLQSEAATEETAADGETSPADELKEGKLELSDDEIRGSGYDSISIYVDTEKLAKRDNFRIEFTGPTSAVYNPVINDELDKTNDGRYDFDSLEGEQFTVRATSSDDVILSYKYNEDGYPTIVLESVRAEKSLTTDSLYAADGSEAASIKGEGYDSITIKFNTEELSAKAAFKLYVETEAEAKVDGEDATRGIAGLNKETGSVTVEDLDGESFVAYVISDNEEVEIKTLADVDSVEDGVAVITVDNVDTKRVYEYEDDKVKVTATLEKADAVPDDAYFDVTPLTEEEAEKYLEALNADKDVENGDVLATAENTLLYNIGFYTDESKSEEIEPEEGSVKVTIEFKKDQLAEDIGAENAEDIVVTHIVEDGSNITTEEVVSDSSVEDGIVDFTSDSFSIYAIHNKSLNFKVGTKLSYTEILGNAVNYGFVAGKYQSGSHVDSNFATKVLTGSAQITGGKYTGNGNPGNYIIGDYNDTGFWVDAGKPFIIYVDKNDVGNFNSNMDSRPVIYNTDYSTAQLQKQVDDLIKGTKSSALYSESNNNTSWLDKIYDENNQKYHLDLTQYPEGTYYFMFGAGEFSKVSQADKLRIYINSDQNVVFNIPDTKVSVEKFLLSIDGEDKYSDASDSTTDPYCRSVVFNMPNATDVNLSGVFGIFLAPKMEEDSKADVHIGTTSTGWLVCGGTFTNNGEWHGTWKDMPPSSGTSTKFFAKKTVNGGTPADDQKFKFELYPFEYGVGYSAEPTQVIENDGQLIEFDPVYFDYDDVVEKGGSYVYSYKIVEQQVDGYTLDTQYPSEYVVHVKVVADTENRTLSVAYNDNQTKVLKKGGNDYWGKNWGENDTCIQFNNLTPNVEKKPISYKLEVKKILKDKKGNDGKELDLKYWPAEFKFISEPYEDQKGGNIAVTPNLSPGSATIKWDTPNHTAELGTVEFDDLEELFNSDNTWVSGAYNNKDGHQEVRTMDIMYKVSEIIENAPGVTYDDEGYSGTKDGVQIISHNVKLWINIERRVENNVIKYSGWVEPRYSKMGLDCDGDLVGPLKFTNYYDTTGHTEIYGLKEFDNKKRVPVDKEFTFNLKDENGNILGTAKNDKDGRFVFSWEQKDGAVKVDGLNYTLADLGGKRSKTFTYTLEEDLEQSECTDKSVKCLTGPKTFHVTVTDNNGTNNANSTGALTVENDFDSPESPATIINTYGADGKVQFYAEKDDKETSPELAGRTFYFQLKEGDVVKETIPVKVGETKPFTEIKYDKTVEGDLGEHNYTITEVDKGEGGVTYSTNAKVYHIQVNVEDNGKNDLDKTIKVGYDDDTLEPLKGDAVAKAVFVNKYTTISYKDSIEGEKTLIGKTLEDGEFQFTLAFDKYVGTNEEIKTEDPSVIVMPSKKTVTNDASGNFRFGTQTTEKDDRIEFKKAGTYTFTVVEEAKEETSDSEGQTQEKRYIPDGTTYVVTFEIIDNGKGGLTLKENGKTIKKQNSDTKEDKIGFTNRYVNKTSIPLYAIKNFDSTGSRTIKDGEFKFKLENIDGLDTINATQNDVGNVGSLVSFSPLNYNTNMLRDNEGNLLESRDFKYRITEIIPWDDIVKDENDKYVTKSVGGHTYYVANNGLMYDINAEKGIEVTVRVERDNINTSNETLKKPYVLNNLNADSNDSNENQVKFYNRYEASGSFNVPLVKTMVGREFDEDDVFTFGLFEPGNTTAIRTIEIKGSDFLNKYQTGTDPEKDMLWFGEVPIDSAVTRDYTVREISCVTASGKEVSVSPDKYIVRLTSKDDGFGNIECPTTVYRNEVKDENVVSNGVCVFENYYAKGTTYFELEKKYAGTIERGQFEFFLTYPDGTTVTRENGYGKDNEEIADLYKVIFDDITYERGTVLKNEDGSYEPKKTLHYTMGEVKEGRVGNITYNTENAVYDVAVTIKDKGNGELDTSDVVYTKLDKTTNQAHTTPLGSSEKPYINNEYHTTGEETVFATKILEGREFSVGEDQKFQFKLTPETGAPGEPLYAYVTADKEGNTAKATFGPFHYTEADLDGNTSVSGSHKSEEPDSNGFYEYKKYYTLEEVIPADATKKVMDETGTLVVYEKDGYIYDTTKYTVEVTLKDNGKGHIDTSWKAYTKDTQPAERGFFAKLWQKIVATLNLEAIGIENADHQAVFVNKYESAAALKLRVTKNLVGEGWTKNDGDFKFTLTGEREKGDGKESYTDPTKSIEVKRNEDGTIKEPREYKDVEFNIVTFTRAGEYEYTIKEDPVKEGFVCEAPEHTVKVEVRENDNANGKLVVYASIDGGAMEKCSVEEGADAKDGNGNAVDLYVPSPVIITNTYEVKPIKVKFGGDKTLTGRPVDKNDTFTFDVVETDAEGTALSGGYKDSKTITAVQDGDKYVLPAFEFNEIGYSIDKLKDSNGNYAADKTFYYTVSEIPGTIQNVEYDATQYKVVVKVTNLKNGKLQVDVVSSDLDGVSVLAADAFKITNDDITTAEDGTVNIPVAKVAKFDNKYIVPGKLPLEVKKVVSGSDAPGLKFDFTLTGDVKNDLTATVTTGQNNNTAKFADITYDYDEIKAAPNRTKTYHYTVTENLPKDEQGNEIEKKGGITYTRDKYEITVVVTAPTDLTQPLDIKETVSKYSYNNGYSDTPDSDYNEKDGIYLFSFTNEYDASGELDIPGKKMISGVENPEIKTFQFEIKRVDANGNEVAFEEGEVAQSIVDNDKNGDFHFEMNYTLASLKDPVRYYKIKEHYDEATKEALNKQYQAIYGADARLDFSTAEFTIEVKLEDEGNGHIKATKTKGPELKFDNPLVMPNSIQFKAEKTLEGRPLKGDWFKFTLTKDEDKEFTKSGVVVVREDGQTADITFPAETFTLEDAGKTYHYSIVEEDYSAIKGVKRIVTSYKAEVKITNDNNKIKVNKEDVKVTCEDPKDSVNVAEVTENENGSYIISGIEFKNEYSSEVEIELKGEKHISGFDENPDEDFTFALYNFSDQKNPVKINDDGKVGSEGDEQKFTVNPSKDKDLTFTFKKIKYDQNDAGNTFHYVIKEVVPENKTENVSYSTIWYDITVAVDYAGANKDGVLTATVTQKKMDGNSELSTNTFTSTYNEAKNLGSLEVAGFDFTNRYLYNSIAFAAIKDLKGRTLGKAGTYEFVLTDKFNNKTYPAVKSDDGGEAAFDVIPYGEGDLDKVHEYTITENTPKDGSELDPDEAQSYRIVVTPYEDSTDGKLKLKKEFYAVYKDGSEKEYNAGSDDTAVFNFVFKNIYNRDGHVEVPVKKILVNKALDPDKDKFKFTLKDASGAKIRVKDGDKFVEKEYLEVSNETIADLARKELKIDGVTRNRRFAESDEFYFDSIWYNSKDDLGDQDEVTKYYIVTEEVGEDSKSYIEYSKTEYVVEVTIKATDDPKVELAQITNFEGSDEIKGDETKTNSFIEWIKSLGKKQEKISKNCEFINIYSADCEIDPPILRKQIMGRSIVPGEFKFEITGPALESVAKYKDGYHNVVQNGIVTETNETTGVTTTSYLDNPGEIFVGDIIYKINKDFDDLQYGEELTADEKAHVGADADKYTKFVYTAKEVKGEDTKGFIYSDVELTLTVFVMDDGEGHLKVKGLGNSDFWDKKDNPGALKWIESPNTKNLVEVETEVEEKDADGNTVRVKKNVDIVNIFNQEGHIDLEGKKIYNGPDFDANKFKFTITETSDPEGRNPISKAYEVPNTGDGTIGDASLIKFDHNSIDILKYEAGAKYDESSKTYKALPLEDVIGPHYYVIEETAKDDESIDYDYSKYVVTVTVSETYRTEKGQKVYERNSDGKPYLTAEVTNVSKIIPGSGRPEPFKQYTRTGSASEGYTYHTAFSFKNEREAYGNASITGIKLLHDQAGNPLVSPKAMEGQFGFALHQYSNESRTGTRTLISSTRCAADGSFTLDVLKDGKKYAYDLDDLKDEKGVVQNSKTFYYRVTETKPSIGVWAENNTVFESEGIIYDLVEYDVDVTVTFDGSKDLKVTKTIRNADTKAAVESKYTSAGKDLGFTNIVKEYTVIEGNKYWIDNFTNPKDRPTVTVNLYQRTASGVEKKINSYDIVAPDTTYRFATDDKGNELPAYDAGGRPYTYVVEETPIEGYLSEKINYDFYNTAGDILIRKIDADTRAPLAGAVLAIIDGGREIERWTSGASAHVVDSALTPGRTYTLREIEAPEGYELADDMTFTVPTDGDTITVTMSDRPIIGSVRLTKVDASTRDTLAGAEFALYNEAGTRIYATGTAGSYRATSSTSNGVFVTDGSGSLTIADLPYGTYYFIETKAPAGYALSTERLGFTIVRGGELVEVTFTDTKAVGSVRLRKVGSTGATGLGGAVFELYARTPRSIGEAAASTIFTDAYYRYGTYRTNSAGEIYVDGLPWDDYFFVEVDAPTGYEVMTDIDGYDLVYTFTIGAGSAYTTIDLGDIINNPEEEETPPPTGGVLGARTTPKKKGVLSEKVKKGGVVQGVLGVRAKPNKGVLGVRTGPVTGDASNIILWSLLLAACIATIVATIMTGRKKKTAK